MEDNGFLSKRGFFVLAVTILLGLACPSAFAQEPEELERLDSLSSWALENICLSLEELDLIDKMEESEDEDIPNVISWRVENEGLIAHLKTDGEYLLGIARWEGEEHSLNRINEWNNEKNYVKAYVDEEGLAVLTFKARVEGRSSWNLILLSAVFLRSLEDFDELISD
ncbi:MAG: YbjN domain-containing protein [Planctomycetia bacterium]|nr:YbjN domain-containing protein [Planctomycetia bacterium]